MAIQDLVRTVRFGGPQARPAANALLETAQTGQLKPHEVVEVKQLIADPALHDVFKDGLGQSISQALSGGNTPVRDVKALLPNKQALGEGGQLGNRFGADLRLMKEQLVDDRLPKDENAGRLMEFFSSYAEQFVALNHPDATNHALPVAQLRPEEAAKVIKQFEKALNEGGFKQLTDLASGRNGLEIARGMLDSKTVDEVRAKTKELVLEGPARKDPNNPNAALSIAVSAAHTRLLKEKKDEEEERKHRKGRSGKLGSNMLWNALHLFREGAETEDEKKELNRLIFTAGLLLVFFAIILTVLLMTI